MLKHHRPNKRKTITNALSRLGWQAHGKEVVALLAQVTLLGIYFSRFLPPR
jgi:hypothetical protein